MKTVLLIVATAFLCTAHAAELVTRTGEVREGDVTWQDSAFVVKGRKVPVKDVVEIRFTTLQTLATDQHALLHLIDGTILAGRVPSASKTSGLRIETCTGATLKITFDRIQSLVFRQVRRPSAPVLPALPKGQVHVVMANGNLQTGSFSYLTPTLFGLRVNGKRERIRKNAAAAIHFRTAANASDGNGFLVRTTCGDRLVGNVKELTSKTLVFASSVGEMRIPVRNIASLERRDSKFVALSDRKPSKQKQTAYFDVVHPPRFNTDLFGFPLRVGSVTYAKGIAMHSRTELEFNVRDATLFVGMVGLDTRYSQSGTARLTILCDGKKARSFDLKRGAPLTPLQLPLRDCGKLGFVLDFGEFGSSGDHALILNPKLVKR